MFLLNHIMKYGTIMERETREPGGLPSIYAEGLTLQTKEYPVGHRPGIPGGKKLSAAHSKVGKKEPGKAEKEPGPEKRNPFAFHIFPDCQRNR